MYTLKNAPECVEADMPCAFEPQAKQKDPTYKDGTCASQGYTVKGQSKVIPFPKGNVTLTEYTKPGDVIAKEDCQMYTLKNAPECVEADMPCAFEPQAKQKDPTYKD